MAALWGQSGALGHGKRGWGAQGGWGMRGMKGACLWVMGDAGDEVRVSVGDEGCVSVGHGGCGGMPGACLRVMPGCVGDAGCGGDFGCGGLLGMCLC